MEHVQEIVWPFSLTKFDALNASVGWYRTPTCHITSTATTTTTAWVWFFGLLDDPGQIYRNGFAWFSVARTQNVLKTATFSLIEYGAAAVNVTIGSIVVVIESSHH